jgi:hypothetical protein
MANVSWMHSLPESSYLAFSVLMAAKVAALALALEFFIVGVAGDAQDVGAGAHAFMVFILC